VLISEDNTLKVSIIIGALPNLQYSGDKLGSSIADQKAPQPYQLSQTAGDMVATRSQKQRCLVTGGAGFLGQHLVDQLVASGKYEVSVFDIREAKDSRVLSVVGDLRKEEQVAAACQGGS
jgi:FlaA1/EpsC-like NDP-sugar epimerase